MEHILWNHHAADRRGIMCKSNISYKDSGVHIEEGYETVKKIKKNAERTHTENVLGSIGGFGAMFALPTGYKQPVLISGTDGVGTKLDVALRMKKYDTVGIDCVAMCINDILCHGAEPLFFLDYLACGKLDSEVAAEIVQGISEGCLQSGASLIGGETAEMPGFYDKGKYDIAGFAVGVAEKSKIIDGKAIKEGDILIGIPSSGLHSNGFSLARMIFKDMKEEFNGKEVGEVLLTPTKIYVKPVMEVLKHVNVKGMAHITGGGLYENVPRILPKGVGACILKDNIPEQEIFNEIMRRGVSEDEMYRTFNMGVGFLLCVDKKDMDETLRVLYGMGEKPFYAGYIEKGEELCLR